MYFSQLVITDTLMGDFNVFFKSSKLPGTDQQDSFLALHLPCLSPNQLRNAMTLGGAEAHSELGSS